MNASFSLRRSHLLLINLVTILVVLFTLAAPTPGMAQKPSSPEAITPDPIQSGQLQFKSENHLVGFEATRAKLVGLDHMLEVEFLGTHGAMPTSSNQMSTSSLPALQQVTYSNLWQGISLRYGVEAGAVAKSEYRVAPGANPSAIRLLYNIPPVLQEDGSLAFTFEQAQGTMVESAPVAWQEIKGSQVPVQAAFTIGESGEVGFTVGSYDPAYELVIDPAYRWHSFFGGKPTVDLVGMCASNFTYVVGTTTSNLYIEGVTNELGTHYNGGDDIVVFTLDGAAFVRRAAYFGTISNDRASSIACSGTSFYIVGSSANTWQGYNDTSPIHAHSGGQGNDIAVIKLSEDGTTLHNLVYNWHTFFGATDIIDDGNDIAVNGTDLYIAGSSAGTWQGPAPATANPKHAYQGDNDFVVLKLTTAGLYAWHTFYGGVQGVDSAYGIASSGNDVWVVGASDATWKGGDGTATSINPLHPHSTGNNGDVTVLKLDWLGAYVWHTFYGSTSSEYAAAVTLHSTNGSGYIVGTSSAAWTVDGSAAPIHAYTGNSDIFVLSLSSTGASQWHTFYGSSDADEGRDITRDTSNNLYIAGYSASTWIAPAAPIDPFSARGDILVLTLTSTGAYTQHDFYGGTAPDGAWGINMNGNLPMIAGFSEATWNGTADEAPKEAHTGSHDGVFLHLKSSSLYSRHGFIDSGTDDFANAITIDTSGNIIIAGKSYNSWRYNNTAPLHGWTGGLADMVVLKLNSSGTYLWHTFYGGPLWDNPNGVACDPSGNIYITGDSNEPWNGPTGQLPINAYADASDIFVLKLNSSGTYQWHTFYGGDSLDSGNDIIYSTWSTMLYVAGNSYTGWTGLTSPKVSHHGGKDMVAVAIQPVTGAYQWHTFYGSASDDSGSGITTFSTSVYITGNSQATWNGPASQSPKHVHDGSESNLVVLRLTDTGNYGWHTFYGNKAYGYDIGVDGFENLYVLAANTGSWLGPSGQLPTHPHANLAMVVMKLNAAGVYQWHGFFGSGNDAMQKTLSIGSSGDIWIACEALLEWQAYGTRKPIHAYTGDRDGMLLQLSNDGIYKHHTYFGGSGREYVAGAVVNTNGEIVVAGYSNQNWTFSGTPPKHVFNKASEIYVASFAPLSKTIFLPTALK